MLSINEACRYANYLKGLFNDLTGVMQCSSYYIKTVENHQKSKGNKEAQDEELTITYEKPFTCSVSDLAYLVKKVAEEKLMLSLAIEKAKRSLTLDFEENGVALTLDSAIAYNDNIREFCKETLAPLSKQKPRVDKKLGSDYKINNEGNQTTYKYPIEYKTELLYNVQVVKDLNKKLLDKADRISTQINEASLKPAVDFNPAFSIYDSYTEVIEKFEAELPKPEINA